VSVKSGVFFAFFVVDRYCIERRSWLFFRTCKKDFGSCKRKSLYILFVSLEVCHWTHDSSWFINIKSHFYLL